MNDEWYEKGVRAYLDGETSLYAADSKQEYGYYDSFEHKLFFKNGFEDAEKFERYLKIRESHKADKLIVNDLDVASIYAGLPPLGEGETAMIKDFIDFEKEPWKIKLRRGDNFRTYAYHITKNLYVFEEWKGEFAVCTISNAVQPEIKYQVHYSQIAF